MALAAKPEMKVSATDALGFEHEPAPPKRRRWPAVLFAVLVIGGSAGIAWMLYGNDIKTAIDFGGGDVPLIRAAQGPVKVRPEKPGGMNVPNRDKLVYGRMQGEIGTSRVERLLPPPEQPLPSSAMPKPAADAVLTPRSGTSSELPPPAPVSRPTNEVVNIAPPPPSAGGPRRLVAPGQRAPAPVQPAPPAQPRPVVQPAPLSAVPSARTVAEAVPPPPAPPAPTASATPAPLKPRVLTSSSTSTPPTATPREAPAPQVASRRTQESGSPGTDTYRVQLLAARSNTAAEAEWLRLRRQNLDILGNLGLAVTRADLGTRGVFFRLRAGPLANEAAAKALCQRLKQRKVGCLVVRPGR